MFCLEEIVWICILMINEIINCFCSEKVEEDVFLFKDVEERLLDLYVELLKFGLGSSYCELF